MSRIIGLDVGDVRIGVAVTDAGGSIASPHSTITYRSHRQALDAVAALVRDCAAERVVVGMPYSLDGTEGPRAELTRRFADRLKGRLEVPVVLMDERFSTREAESLLLSDSLSRERRREVVDQVAAALILQKYIDREVAQ